MTGKAFHLVSLGCPKNRVDSERIAFVMMESGFELIDDAALADVIVVNSCSFVAPAVAESLDMILDLREENPRAILVVAGCLPLRYGETLGNELPEVDLFVDPGRIAALPRLIVGAAEARTGCRLGLPDGTAPDAHKGACGSTLGRAVSTPGYAYLKIAEGCSRRCAYCTIPAIRGPLASVDPDDLQREVESLAERGVREIVVVAQDLTAYGADRGGTVGLVKLLGRIERVSGIDWIRLMYLHPAGITRELPALINESERILPYLDVPFQHVSARVLRAMGRPWRGDPVRRLVEGLRGDIPNLVLRTTFMVGFPGETDREFEELREFVTRAGIEHVGVFEYSPEEGTAAWKRGDPVPEDEKRARADEIRAIHSRFSHKWHRARVGGIEEVLVEGFSSETDLLLQGRARHQAPEVDGVTYITAGDAAPGEICLVRITDAHGPDLFGEISTEAATSKAHRLSR